MSNKDNDLQKQNEKQEIESKVTKKKDQTVNPHALSKIEEQILKDIKQENLAFSNLQNSLSPYENEKRETLLKNSNSNVTPNNNFNLQQPQLAAEDINIKKLENWMNGSRVQKQDYNAVFLAVIAFFISLTALIIGTYIIIYPQKTALQTASTPLDGMIPETTKKNLNPQKTNQHTQIAYAHIDQLDQSANANVTKKTQSPLENTKSSFPLSSEITEEKTIETSQLTTITTSSQIDKSASCQKPEVNLTALRGGQTNIKILSPCHKSKTVTLDYSGFKFTKTLDNEGKANIIIDAFAGDTNPLNITFSDGAVLTRKLTTTDLNRISKVAVIWQGATQINLHAFEYAASQGEAGHIWAKKKMSFETSRELTKKTNKGRGFISSFYSSSSEGQNIQVYTFYEPINQPSAVIKLALSFHLLNSKQNQPLCLNGQSITTDYQTVRLIRNQKLQKTESASIIKGCVDKIQFPVQINSKAINDLVVGQ